MRAVLESTINYLTLQLLSFIYILKFKNHTHSMQNLNLTS